MTIHQFQHAGPLVSSVEEASQLVARIRQFDSANFVGLAIVILEWILNLQLEVSLVWQAKRSPMKLLYIMTRYLPFSMLCIQLIFQFGGWLSQESCAKVYYLASTAYSVTTCFAELTLAVRTWAVLGKTKRLAYILFGGFCGIWITIFLCTVFYNKSATYLASPVSPLLAGCVVTGGARYLVWSFALISFYNGVMLALMTAQALPALRSEYTLPLTRLIYRDGVIYYVYIFLLSLINAIMIVALPSDLASILVIIEGTMHWVLACRVVLHIREQAYIQQASPLFALSTQQSNEAQLSPLEFDSPHEDAGYP